MKVLSNFNNTHKSCFHTVWGRCGRRRRRYSPCSRRCAGFAWWSGCRAQFAARIAWEGRRGRGWWRTARKREWERWTQGETHMYMDDMTGLRTWSQMVHVTQHQSVKKTTRSQCMLRCCASCACSCSMSLYLLLMWFVSMLVLSALVVLHAVFVIVSVASFL